MNAPPAAPPPLPLHNSYWVVPGLVLAGEHPIGPTPARTKQRLERLLSAGIGAFLDLTHPEEVPRYDHDLPFSIDYRRHPIQDHGLPASPAQMIEILDSVQECLSARRPLYVHCRAGIGRTGIVMGCLLAERGLSGDEALRELNRLWQQCRRSKNWAFVPETDDQVNYIRSWQTGALRAARVLSKGSARAQAPAARAVEVPPPAPKAPSRERPRAARAPAPRVVSDPLLEPDTLRAARGLRDRFMGALLGLAVGDAVAAATQFGRPGSFRAVGDMLGGGPFDLPRGAWSDDTAMALCLADSLLERNAFDAHDQVSRYTRWQQDGYLSATGHCVGITASTARALAMSKWRRQMFAGSHDPKLLDPEPLSRVGPAVLFFFSSPEAALQHAADAARTTCQAPDVLEDCRSFAGALHAILSGQPRERALAGTKFPSSAAAQRTDTSSGVLQAAFWAFASTDSFRDAVLRSANLGGNCDVVAAVCGQLAGALYGHAAIPASWINSLMHKDLIESYGDRLLTRCLLSLGS